jgi:YrbI family 3-deoxy-D-manno-octulosonate 8-phosphate phosphatase
VNKAVITRANKLGIECYNGVKDKSQVLNTLSINRGVDLSKSMFIGNDLNDLIALKSVGYPACPKDAVEEVKDIAKYVFDVNGGAGIVRQVYKLLN